MSFNKLKFTIIALVIGGGALIAMFTEMGKAGRFASGGVRTVGTVDRVWREESRGRRGRVTHNFYMALDFQTREGRPIRVQRHSVGESSFSDHRRGDQINITYVHDNPQEIHLGHKEYSAASIPLLAVTATLCLGFVGWQCRSLLGLGVVAAGRLATSHGDGQQTANADSDKRMDEAIARAMSSQQRQPSFATRPAMGPSQSAGFRGAATSEAPRASFGRRRA